MKYLVLLTDGMSDHQLEELGGKTVMQYAKTPNLDYMAANGVGGFVKSTPDGYYPGSDICNLTMMGYDPTQFYSGRSPLEAGSAGIELGTKDMSFRCNLVTLDGEIMEDNSAHHIDNETAGKAIDELNAIFNTEGVEFYKGLGFRNLMVLRDVDFNLETTPPHDIMGQDASGYLPKGKGSEKLIDVMERAKAIFSDGKYGRANGIWFWGEGTRPAMPLFKDLYGMDGAVVAAVDLIRGIGRFGGMNVLTVPGATGFIDTNFEGKAEYAVNAFKDADYVFLHVEAADEAGHMGSIEEKVKAVENIDSRMCPIILEGMKQYGDFRILVSPDHPTPVKLRTHVAEPVPAIIFGTGVNPDENQTYDEFMKPTFFIEEGYKIADFFLKSTVING
ncbi:proposed homoserine kinase [Denitrovibrio acetiphilus DSM 12809]|uniref:Proposed homoserine kinase n=1 Tax=Denitrovibrio acetiphilus (strain DSM 12809 / NBRC 114555 / N2460) TaxID=522772 RepID=D4H839_DENA2|nr:cofactor-independent phosphoglycerate mutase [Denitrovibrio acetiphilus]ADD68188.1 proposed homoserine kinase [Denitrovibrio acetiphilus DSM 12809]